MLDDENKKALIAKTLLAKDPDLFGPIYRDIMGPIDVEQLNPTVKALLTLQ